MLFHTNYFCLVPSNLRNILSSAGCTIVNSFFDANPELYPDDMLCKQHATEVLASLSFLYKDPKNGIGLFCSDLIILTLSSYYSQIFGAVDVCDVCHSRYYLWWGAHWSNCLITCGCKSRFCTYSHSLMSMMICRLNVVLHFGLMGTSPLMLSNPLNNQALGSSSSASRKIGHLVLINGAMVWMSMLYLSSKWSPGAALRCVTRPDRWQRISQRGL